MVDYVSVTNAGESGLRQGDYLEVNEAKKLNDQLKKDKKRTMELAPFSFYLSAWEEDRHTIAQAIRKRTTVGPVHQMKSAAISRPTGTTAST